MNFAILALVLAASASSAQEPETLPPLPEQADSDIGYSTPAAALKALRNKPGVKVSESADWYVVEDSADNAMWTFTRRSHPAHPSAVKRSLETRDGTVNMTMKVKCGASKEACDTLVREYQELNAQMAARIKADKGQR